MGVLSPSHDSYSKAAEGGTVWAVFLPALDKASSGPIVLQALANKSPLNSSMWGPQLGDLSPR